jgi:23S rRNA pseudouridine2457 synthase
MKYFALNKPYGVLSQFTGEDGKKTLADLYNFPENVYPVGRLDMDSEGLLLLTDDKSLTEYLLNPENKHEREYYVEVEGIPTDEELRKLESGVIIEDKLTLPAKAKLLTNVKIEAREVAIRFRKNVPDSWISLTLTEGRNRQVRKMTASIRYPTLRLIRIRIKNILLGDLKPGQVRELSNSEIKELKGL